MTDEYIRDTNSAVLIGVASLCFGLSAFVVLLRVFVRTVLRKNLGADDYSILGALVRAYCSVTQDPPTPREPPLRK